jgi:hypothetical protein
MKKTNLTKQFYVSINESSSDELVTFIENFIDKNSCYQLREYLIKYREAIDAGKFTITAQERADLDRSIDSEECKVGEIIEKGGLKCCYKETTKEDNYLCGVAQKKMKKQLTEKVNTDRNTVLTQMCWFNDNYIKDTTVKFCPSNNQTQQGTNTQIEIGNTQTQQGTNTSTEVSNKTTTTDDKNKGTVEQPKVEEKPKPKPIEASDEVKTSFENKYPCLNKLQTKTIVNDDGSEFSYKVEMIDEDETVYYYLSGKCKIKKSDGSVQSKYFHC